MACAPRQMPIGRGAALQRSLDHGEFLLEEGIALDLVDADRAAEHDEEIGVARRRQIIDAGV